MSIYFKLHIFLLNRRNACKIYSLKKLYFFIKKIVFSQCNLKIIYFFKELDDLKFSKILYFYFNIVIAL